MLLKLSSVAFEDRY